MNKTYFGELCAALQLAAPPPPPPDPKSGLCDVVTPWNVSRTAQTMDRAAMALHRLAERACNGPEFKPGEQERLEAAQKLKLANALLDLGLPFDNTNDARSHSNQKNLPLGRCLVEWQGDPRGAAVMLALNLGSALGVRTYALGYGS